MGTLGTITVTTLLDVNDGVTTSISELMMNPGADGEISLREAIIAANNTGGADAIQLASGVHTLSMSGTGMAESGDLDITDNVEIIGAADGSSEIDATGLGDRVFEIHSEATLKNLTVTGGDETATGGGGISCLLYTSPSPRDQRGSRMPSSA